MFTRFGLAGWLLLIALSLSVTGCGGQQSAIVGKWERVSQNITVLAVVPDRIEFLQDGTFVMPTFFNTSGKYSFPDSSHIKLDSGTGASVFMYTLSGDSLTLEIDNGGSAQYQRTK
ncbi:MAG: hypothetical protein M1482_01265 [Chloroflexi bacterium]|nr:hypothetical protein [Chloroflexota bacterium]